MEARARLAWVVGSVMCSVGEWKGCVFGEEEGEGVKRMDVGSTGRMVVVKGGVLGVVEVESGVSSEGAGGGGGVERVMAPVLLLLLLFVTVVKRRKNGRRRSLRKRVAVDDGRLVVRDWTGDAGTGTGGGRIYDILSLRDVLSGQCYEYF